MGVAEETTGWMDADSTDVDHVNDAVREHAGEVGDRAVSVGLVLDSPVLPATTRRLLNQGR